MNHKDLEDREGAGELGSRGARERHGFARISTDSNRFRSAKIGAVR
jgi:hypothetical protein